MIQIKRTLTFVLPTLLLGLVGLGILLQRYDASRKSDLLQFLGVIQASLDTDNVAVLTGSAQDVQSVDFQKLQATFSKLSNTHPSVRYIYLMRRVDDQVIFLMDSKSKLNPSDEPLAVPGEVYKETSDDLLRIFDSGKNTVIGPESDRWGTFISALGPVFDNNGQFTGLLGVDVDFGEWYRSKIGSIAPYIVVLLLVVIVEIIGVMLYFRQQQHLQTQAHLANIVETSHDAIVSLNLDGTVRSWNHGASEIFGYTATEAIGKKGSDLVYFPDQKDTFNSIYSKIRLGQVVRNLEAERHTKDGRKVTVLISANPIYNGNSIAGISVVAKDITIHSNSQKNLATRNQELERLNKLMVDRELKMAELKSQIKSLKAKK